MRRLLPLVFSLLYATVLTNLPLDAFLDRENYLTYARHSDEILARYTAIHSVAVFANEPLWLLLNIGLAKIFDTETVLRILIFIPAFLVPWLLIRHNPRHALWLMLLMLMPQVIKNHIIHLRQGVGLAIFLLGYFSASKWRARSLMLAASLVHLSFLFILFILGLVVAFRRMPLSPRLRIIVLMGCFGVLGLFSSMIAGALGARQGAQYIGVAATFSGMGFIFWAMAILLFLSAGRKFLEDNMFALAIECFYLATYFYLPVAARIFESGLSLVLISGLNLPGWRRSLFLFMIFSYILIQYSMNLGSDWLGWGANL